MSGLSAEELAEIREMHFPDGGGWCSYDGLELPCQTLHLLDAITARDQEIERLRRTVQELEAWAGQIHHALDGRALPDLPDEAPARIAVLRQEIERLREALRPFADHHREEPSHRLPTDPQHRAWCLECSEWCYSDDPDLLCRGCFARKALNP